MSGIALSFGFDDGPIRRHLAALAILDSRHFDGVRREIGEYFRAQVQDNLDGQKLFDGSPMPQSKRALGLAPGRRSRTRTKAMRKAGRWPTGKTLIDSHNLYDDYNYQLVGAGVEIGSILPYAAIHHFGGETGATGHRFTLPARPVLGVGPKEEKQIGDFLVAEIQRSQQR